MPYDSRRKEATPRPRSGRRLAMRSRSGLLAGAALTAALALLGSPAAAREQAGTAASTPTCAMSGLVAWIDTQGNGAAGSISYNLRLTNLSGRTCTLSGYPRVAGVDLGGRQLGSGSGRERSSTPRVTLRNLATASILLEIVDVYNFSPGYCGQVTAAGLRLYAPGQSSSKVIPFPFKACSRTGPGYLRVQAVRSGG